MNRFITSVLFGLVTINTMVMADPTRPRLVVQIVVDQLRTDYVEYLRGLFGDKGFNRLIKEGTYLRDVDFGVPGLDMASATAMLATGAYPADAGIPSGMVFDAKSGKMVPALHDPSTLGNFTDETYSPARLLLSTVSDELAIDGAGLAAVYSIAGTPQQAVILAGHAGNSAVWLNANTGKWASSAYYGDMPLSASQRNHRQTLTQRVDTMQWKPALDLKRYPGIPAHKRQYAFRYTFPSSDRDVYRRLIASPLGNREITSLAADYLTNMRLGQRGDVIDMLSIGLTAAPFKYVSDGDYRLELQDTYLRLDADLGRLLDVIDSTAGLDNTLVIVTSTGYYDDATPDDPKYRIPSGEFSTRRAVSLLNSYLSAKYGNGNYISAFADGALYLDHRALESARADSKEAISLAREFICKMSGVRGATTLDEILSGATQEADLLRRRVLPSEAADIYVDFAPGWNVADETTYPPTVKPVRSCTVSTPAFLMGPAVPVSTVSSPVDATTLAPTVTQVLRIRSPNGSTGRPRVL